MKKERLIEEVKKYPYLYDSSNSKYNDTLKKDEAWRKIGTTLNRSESECKKIWLNLRESHRRSIKKRKAKSDQAATTTKKWTFEDEMSFLVPHYRARKKISTVAGASGDDEGSDVSISLNDDSQNSNEIQSPQHSSVVQPETFEFTSASSVTSNIPKNPTKSGNVEYNASPHSLMKYLIDEKKTKEDEIDTFFKSIAATVKKFSEYNQAVIKSKIYNSVSEMELKEIADKQKHYSYGDPYIPQRYDYVPQSVPTTSRMQTQIGASETDDYNVSNVEENGDTSTNDIIFKIENNE